MKKLCTVCDNCLGDEVVTLATHSYDSDARRDIHVCDDCAEMIRDVHAKHPDKISDPEERPDFNRP